ncbi:MAG: hypothetical protein ACYCYR_03190 [Desulfobulbaceae bacterium]|jgi:hypothetical protein
MYKNWNYTFIIIIYCNFFNVPCGYAFDSDYVHLSINDNATKQSNINSYLTNNIGWFSGIEKLIKGKPALEWITSGGTKEDEGIRWFNHFHDPLKPYENAGLWGIPDSSMIWAQNNEKNIASWSNARQLFYDALTTGSEVTYANLLLAIGQLTHLVSDKAVPSHVRNDPHPETQLNKIWKISHFEVWTKNHYDDSTLMDYTHGIKPNAAIFNNYEPIALAPSPVARLWDTNQYVGDNPGVTLNNNIGLAEFTNANFFSEDSRFSSKFPHPSYDDVTSDKIHIQDPFDPAKTVSREYWMKQAAGDLPQYKVSGVNYHTYYLDELYIDGFKQFETFPYLDKYVFQDYAKILIPRAVGYSASLIDYFFRGTLEISPPTEYVYSIIDGGNSPQQFTHIKANVRNTSAITAGTGASIPEATGDGELVAIAKYRIMPNYSDDLSSYPQSATDLINVMQDVPFSYSVSTSIAITSANPIQADVATEYLFDFSQNPIPAGITDLYLQVVFRGTLGSEQNAAIAVGMRDLNEPQHLTFWNDTDYFLLNGTPVKSEDLESDPRVTWYGYIWPFSFTETLAFSKDYPITAATPVITLAGLPPARYSRVILLTDASDAEYYVTDHIFAQRPPPPLGDAPTTFNETWDYTLPSTTAQQDTDGNWLMSPVYTVRGVRQHQRTYLMSFYPYFVYINSLPAPPENDLGPHPATNHFVPTAP